MFQFELFYLPIQSKFKKNNNYNTKNRYINKNNII